jgi:regulator of sigma D
MGTDNIITKLIQQHRLLQNDLGCVNSELTLDKPGNNKIIKLLDEFTNDLNKHLKLENDVFYVELLSKMKNNGIDTTNTEKFILEMHDIGTTVMAFLNKYNSEQNINHNISNFRTDLQKIISALNMRIEAEEEGVYMYW